MYQYTEVATNMALVGGALSVFGIFIFLYVIIAIGRIWHYSSKQYELLLNIASNLAIYLKSKNVKEK